MRQERPRFALVVHMDRYTLDCIELSAVEHECADGKARLIVREFDPVASYEGEPAQSSRNIGQDDEGGD
jgi:hypothetical protein